MAKSKKIETTQDTNFREISPENLEALQKGFDMNFGYYDRSCRINYCHYYKNQRSGFVVVVDGKVPPEMEGVFTSIGTEDQPAYFFHATIADGEKESTIRNGDSDKINATRTLTQLRELRKQEEERQRKIKEKVENKAPIVPVVSHDEDLKMLTVEELADLFATESQLGKVHFFTGAGVSAVAVPDWNSLMGLMGYNRQKTFEENLGDTCETLGAKGGIDKLLNEIHETHKAFIFGEPTPAHGAVCDISALTGCAVLTDNRDLLHQSSGCEAIHVNQISEFVQQPWKPLITCDPSQIKMLVVCGMGGDRRRFIQWVKEHNPEVKIVVVNKDANFRLTGLKPDYFCIGDAQEILPKLKTLLEQKLEKPRDPRGVRVERVVEDLEKVAGV